MIKEKLKKTEIGIGKNLDFSEKQANNKYIYLALGSNLSSVFGSKIKNLEIAQLFLINIGIEIIDRSSYFESKSYPDSSYPNFINCIIKVKTNHTPSKLLNEILKVEKKIGRIRKIKNEPRVCDIDIIDYKGRVIKKTKKPILTIPHEFLHKRSFVLLPLSEINPNWIHPKLHINITQLLNNLNKGDFNSIKKI